MRQGSTASPAGAQTQGAIERARSCRVGTPAGPRAGGEVSGRRWLSEPKTAVWIALAAAVLIGGGRKLSAWWQARKAVARLGEPNVTLGEIEAVAEHGRAGVYELLRIFSSIHVGTGAPGRRSRAGATLAPRSARRRGRAGRRSARLHRDLERPSPLPSRPARRDSDRGHLRGAVSRGWRPPRRTGEPGMVASRAGCSPRGHSRSSRPGPPGRGRVAFTIFPGDFETNGPHRLVLQTRIRTAGLTDSWEIEPPHSAVQLRVRPDPQARCDPDSARLRPVTSRSHGPSGSSRRCRRWRSCVLSLTRRGVDVPQSAPACVATPASVRPGARDLDRIRGARRTVRGRPPGRERAGAVASDGNEFRDAAPSLRTGSRHASAAWRDRAAGPAADASLARGRPGQRLG